jgi:hypothetical protein
VSDESTRPDRLSCVEAQPFRPDSLVGSFFHGDVERGWQGCVVAEPAPGVYLLELFEWFMGSSSAQQLVHIEEMTGWRFYDTTEWMNSAYEHGVKQRWEHERAEKKDVAAEVAVDA